MLPLSPISWFAKPGVTRVFATLDDDNSMLPIVVRDAGMDIPGRLYQAARRDGAWNEEFIEQLIDQVSAMLIWGFGVDLMRRGINSAAVNLDKAPKWVQKVFKGVNGVKIKDLSLELFDDANKAASEQAPQTLTFDKVSRYQKAQQAYLEGLKQSATQPSAVASLKETVTKQAQHIKDFFTPGVHKVDMTSGLMAKYNNKEIIKMVGAALVPALMLGVGVPMVFQAITRARLKKRKEKEQAVNAFSHLAARPLASDASLAQVLQQPSALAGMPMGSDAYPATVTGRGPQFSGNAIQYFFKQARESLIVNTLIVDGVISGGRVVMARNVYDRLENLIQEAGTIFFLFFAMKPIKNFFYNLFDRTMGTFSRLSIHSTEAMHKMVSKSPKAFIEQLSGFKQQFLADNSDVAKALSAEKLGKKEYKAATKAFEQALFKDKGLENYLLSGKTDNVLYELAKKNGMIDMHSAGKGNQAVSVWNWTKKIDTDGMFDIARSLKKATDKVASVAPQGVPTSGAVSEVSASVGKSLKRLVEKSLAARGIGWVLAAMVCAAAQGWIIPRFKQWVTHQLTGNDRFPGEYNDGKRQGLFSKTVIPNNTSPQTA